MRKITTSLAVLAALFFSSATANNNVAQLQSHDVALQRHHLEQAPFDGSVRGAIVSSSAPSSSTSIKNDQYSDLCDVDHSRASLNCNHQGCFRDDWGCNHVQNRPNQEHFTQQEIAVQATVIPTQVLATNITTNTFGDVCTNSAGQRERHDYEEFYVTGQFEKSRYDVQQECFDQAEAFNLAGNRTANFYEMEGQHDVDACDCNLINADDLLQFEDEHCGCLTDRKRNKFVSDPDDDIRERINGQIDQTIADVLSDIINKALQESFQHTIVF